MDTKVFQELCTIASREAGIKLTAGKEALVAARVAKRLRALGLRSEREYLDYLSRDESGDELTSFLDVISTNFTSFMREADHFAALASWATSEEVKSRQRLRLWCAAASSGEEPYSIVITLLDAVGRRAQDIKLLATDISTKVLNSARAGVYDETALAPLSRAQRDRYFTLHKDGGAVARYAVRPEVKSMISFCRLNLAMPPIPMHGPLDVVFCRNVMIYFDHDVRERLTGEIERLLRPGGILFTGHSETLAGIRSGLRAVKPSIYLKPRS